MPRQARGGAGEVAFSGLTSEEEDDLLSQLKAVQADLQGRQDSSPSSSAGPLHHATAAYERAAEAIAMERHDDVHKLHQSEASASYNVQQVTRMLHTAKRHVEFEEGGALQRHISHPPHKLEIIGKLRIASQHWDQVAAAVAHGDA